MAPLATVIIPHHNDATRLSACLHALDRCDERSKVEVIVVDNGTPSFPAVFPDLHQNTRFLYEATAGAANARNVGVRSAVTNILIFTDSDCNPASDFLTQAIRAAREADITGGDVRLTQSHTNGVTAFEQVFAFNQRRYIEEMQFSVTANLVTSKSVFNHVGPFRADLSEDLDWGQRATAFGYKITYQPDMIVYHPCRTTWTGLRAKWNRITTELYGVHNSDGKPTVLWILRALAMPLSVFGHVPRVLSSPKLTTWGARGAALGVLARLRLWRMFAMIRLTIPQKPAERRRPKGFG